MNFDRAKEYILRKLYNELPKHLYYHGIHHTIDVYETSIAIARKENVDEYDITLLKTAALFHDSGILFVYKGHEEASVELINNILPKFDYTQTEIFKIEKLILATKLPQTPLDSLSEIICDADLDYLGRDDFFINGFQLYREWNALGNTMNLTQWFELQIRFLENHKFFTKTTQNLRDKKKGEHLSQIKQMMQKQK